MKIEKIREELQSARDEAYANFQRKLIPTVAPQSIIGVRTPFLRKYAKELRQKDTNDFMNTLPHSLFEENQLHAFLLSEIKDYDTCIIEIEKFLPYIDNWATCDQLSPKVFKKHLNKLITPIQQWIDSSHTYTVRFAIGMLMEHYLNDNFQVKYPEMVAKVHSNEYYINMMIAWYFATALVKQYDSVIPLLQNHFLDKWTHNKTIQKAIESYRITEEQKVYLKTLRY